MNILSKRNFQNASMFDSEGFWQTIDSDILGLLTFFERFCCEKNGSICQTIPFALSTCQSFNQGLQHFERTLSIFTRCAVDVIS